MEIEKKSSFLKNHADTLAIIGVNIALAAVMISMWISNCHRIDAANSRIDATMTRIDGMYNILMKKND